MDNAASSLRQTSILKILVVALVVYMTAGATFYHFVEKWNWLDSFYFVVITLATVGYGDFVPVTTAGKLFTMPYVFIGIGMFIYVANAFLKNRAERRVQKHRSRKERA